LNGPTSRGLWMAPAAFSLPWKTVWLQFFLVN